MRAYVYGSRMPRVSISSRLSRSRSGIRVRYEPRVPDHSAFCRSAPFGINTFLAFAIPFTSQRELLRRFADAYGHVRMLQSEHAEGQEPGVVDFERHEIPGRGGAVVGPDLVEVRPGNSTDELDVEEGPLAQRALGGTGRGGGGPSEG